MTIKSIFKLTLLFLEAIIIIFIHMFSNKLFFKLSNKFMKDVAKRNPNNKQSDEVEHISIICTKQIKGGGIVYIKQNFVSLKGLSCQERYAQGANMEQSGGIWPSADNYHRFGKENSYLFIKSILVQLTDSIFYNMGRIIAINLKSSKYQEQREILINITSKGKI